MTTETIRVGDHIAMDLILDGERLLGIGGVRHDGTALRNGTQPWRPMLRTPAGVQYADFRLRHVERDDDGTVRVVCDAHGLPTHIRDEQDEYLVEIIDLRDPGPVIDTLTWVLRPSSRCIGDYAFSGFSYAYDWQSRDPARRAWRVFDLATWEIGGALDGNRLLFQSQLNPPAQELTRDLYFTTACNYYGAEMRGRLGPADRVSLQRLPRIATLQAFDFLQHPSGLLAGVFERAHEIMSLLQKEPGEDCLHVLDEHRLPLSDRLQTTPKHILFAPTPRPLSRATVRNTWKALLDQVYGHERQRVGITPSQLWPHVWLPQVTTDTYRFGAHTGPRREFLYALAEHVLPTWADMGVKEICAPSLWQSDYTQMRYVCKNDTGMQGGFTVSGICCVHDHVIADDYGGAAALRHLTERAHALGMAVRLWWATHLSRRAPIFKANPHWMVHSRDGHPGCGGIGNQVCIPMNLNDPDCYAWERDRLLAVVAATGVDGLFHDSYGNYTFAPINYDDPLRRGQQEAYARLVAELQAAGLRNLYCEGLGPWGVGHFGMNLYTDGATTRYQNNLDWWLHDTDMMVGLDMGIGARVWPGMAEAARDFAFRCMAAGGRFGFTDWADGVEHWGGWLRELNRLHTRLLPFGGERVLLEDERGVLWRGAADGDLLFSYSAFAHPLTGRQASVVTGDGERLLDPAPCLHTEALQVYRIR